MRQHANDGGDDEALRRIRTRHEQPRDNPRNKAYDDDPEKNTHCGHPFFKLNAGATCTPRINTPFQETYSG
jgi:hypothetical protein